MRKDITERYERSDDGKIIIDISTEKIEDLYDDFDRRSHFLKKDLNQDLVEYIIESVSEIENEKFIIRFNMDNKPSEDSVNRVKNSVANFFIYMRELELKKMKDMIRTSMILFFTGIIIATLSILLSKSELSESNIVVGVIAEGLTVAAWVSLWESLATFLIKWKPHRKKTTLFERISDSELIFNFQKRL